MASQEGDKSKAPGDCNFGVVILFPAMVARGATLQDLHPSLVSFMARAQAQEGLTPKVRISAEQRRWQDRLQHELAAVRHALCHDPASRTSRLAAWMRKTESAVKKVAGELA